MAMLIGVASGPVVWPLADPIPHVFDVAGPRSDGRLVVAAGGKLFLMDQATGALDRFAGIYPPFAHFAQVWSAYFSLFAGFTARRASGARPCQPWA